MSNPLPSHIRYEPGKIIIQPTDLTLPFPYGGTVIGETRLTALRPNSRSALETCEEFSNSDVQEAYTSDSVILTTTLRNWDSNAILYAFPGAAAGTDPGTFNIKGGIITNNQQPGVNLPQWSILFVPDDRDSYYIYLPEATILVDPTVNINLRLDSELDLTLVFKGMVSTQGYTYQIAKFKDIVLITV